VSLEDELRRAIKSNGLTHLTLFPTRDKQWQASWASSKQASGYSVAIDKDPVVALINVFRTRHRPHPSEPTAPALKARRPLDDEDLI
jgi:hypothetical protein